MAGMSERQKDNVYRRRNNLGPNALKPDKTCNKLSCPGKHKLKTIRAASFVQVWCNSCNNTIAVANNGNGHKRIVGCRQCHYFLCSECYDAFIQTVRY